MGFLGSWVPGDPRGAPGNPHGVPGILGLLERQSYSEGIPECKIRAQELHESGGHQKPNFFQYILFFRAFRCRRMQNPLKKALNLVI